MGNVLKEYEEEVKKFAVLGYMTWWTIRNVLVANEKLEKLYEKHKLEKYFPKHVSERKSFWRALRKFGKQNPDLLIRKIGENDEKIVYGIVAEQQDFAKLDLDYQVECRVTFHKVDKMIEFSESNHPVTKELSAMYDRYRTHYVSDDIRKAILATITSLDSLDVRKQGGMYFVPVKFSDIVARFDALVSDLNTSSTLFSLSIIDTVRTRKQMFKTFMEQADEELNDAETEIKQMREDLNVRQDTVERRLALFKRLRDKARMYADLFKGKASDIEKRIDGMEEVAREVLDKMFEE